MTQMICFNCLCCKIKIVFVQFVFTHKLIGERGSPLHYNNHIVSFKKYIYYINLYRYLRASDERPYNEKPTDYNNCICRLVVFYNVKSDFFFYVIIGFIVIVTVVSVSFETCNCRTACDKQKNYCEICRH